MASFGLHRHHEPSVSCSENTQSCSSVYIILSGHTIQTSTSLTFDNPHDTAAAEGETSENPRIAFRASSRNDDTTPARTAGVNTAAGCTSSARKRARHTGRRVDGAPGRTTSSLSVSRRQAVERWADSTPSTSSRPKRNYWCSATPTWTGGIRV